MKFSENKVNLTLINDENSRNFQKETSKFFRPTKSSLYFNFHCSRFQPKLQLIIKIWDNTKNTTKNLTFDSKFSQKTQMGGQIMNLKIIYETNIFFISDFVEWKWEVKMNLPLNLKIKLINFWRKKVNERVLMGWAVAAFLKIFLATKIKSKVEWISLSNRNFSLLRPPKSKFLPIPLVPLNLMLSFNWPPTVSFIKKIPKR